MKRWYVVHTHPQSEATANFQLTRQGYETYLPKYLKRRRHARRTDWVQTPLFPRYMFVALDLDVDRWRPVLSTIGVSQMVFQGERPAPVPEGLIEAIRKREDESGLVKMNNEIGFKKGDQVHILHDAFGEHTGIFECADDRERVVVLLNIMGRQVRARVPVEAVAAYA